MTTPLRSRLSTLLLIAVAVRGAEIKVVSSGAFTAAFLELAPEYERATHDKLVTEFGPSMGTTHNAIPVRLERGEVFDVVIMAAPALADLIKQGKVRADSRVDLVLSNIGMAVKAGAPQPDISTVDALRRTLLAAKSIAYSDSASGVYLSTELFPKLGIADQIKSKSRKIEADPVGGVVATGEVEIGFQQISELRPVKGIDIVGPLPPGAQSVTVFAAGIPATSKNPEAAKALIRWLASPAAYPVIRKSGLEPAATDAPAQHALLDRITEIALRAQEQLPDFICTQQTRRSEDETGKGRRWKQRDTLEIEFSFVSHRPSWKLLKLNGKPSHLQYGQLRTGFLSEAILQFFSLPGSLFGAEVATVFDWNRWDTLDGQRMAVYSLRVPESTSLLAFSNDEGRHITGFHGLLYADPITAQVTRLEIQSDLPPDFPVQESTVNVDYGDVSIANQAFFLPVRAVVQARIAGRMAKNETEVVRYQKYAADAKVTFSDR